MQIIPIKLLRLGDLHKAAEIHHAHAVGDMAHHRQIVRHKEIGQAKLFLQILEHIDHLRLNGNVQCRDRLIADDKLRINRQSAGNSHSLPLTARKLMRITAGVILIQSDAVEQLQNKFLSLFARFKVMDIQRLADNIGHRHSCIQRGIRILKDHLHLFPIRHKFFRRELCNILAVIANGAARRLIKADQRSSGRGLSASRLAHKAKCLFLIDGKGNVIHRFHIRCLAAEHTVYLLKVHFQIFNFQQMLSHSVRLPSASDTFPASVPPDGTANTWHSGFPRVQTPAGRFPCRSASQIHSADRKDSPSAD